jgi:hypothetical protein
MDFSHVNRFRASNVKTRTLASFLRFSSQESHSERTVNVSTAAIYRKRRQLMPIGRYRIIDTTVAIFEEGGTQVSRTIPVGAVILVSEENSARDDLAQVTWDGKKALMFLQDLRFRAEKVDGGI